MDQDATWYEVDLGPGHIVLDGDPAPPEKSTLFGPCLLWPNGRPFQLLLSRVSLYYTLGRLFRPSKLPFLMGNVDAHLTHGSWADLSLQPKRHRDRLSRFCRAHYCDRPAD